METSSPAAETSSTRFRILIVDDDPAIVHVIRRAAADVEIETASASDGTAALALLDETQFDLIVLDVGLPRMDGRDVLQRIKESPRSACVPVLVFSGRCGQYDRETLHRLGAEDLVEKPFPASSLMRRIMRVIERAHACS